MTVEEFTNFTKSFKLVDNSTGCWLWTGSCSNRYGERRLDNKLLKIHRLSLHVYKQLDLENKNQLACHIIECPNKNCFNPEYLYVGTFLENFEDANITGKRYNVSQHIHQKHSFCKRGHELNKDNIFHGNHGRQCRICLNVSKKKYDNKLKKNFKNEI